MNAQKIFKQFISDEIDDDNRDRAISDLFVYMFGRDKPCHIEMALSMFIRAGIDNEVPPHQISLDKLVRDAVYNLTPEDGLDILGGDLLLIMFLDGFDDQLLSDQVALIEFCNTMKIDIEGVSNV